VKIIEVKIPLFSKQIWCFYFFTTSIFVGTVITVFGPVAKKPTFDAVSVSTSQVVFLSKKMIDDEAFGWNLLKKKITACKKYLTNRLLCVQKWFDFSLARFGIAVSH
jgi:hypothetical protein